MISTFIERAGAAVVSVVMLLMAPFASVEAPAPAPGAVLPQIAAVFETSLAAPITSAATSMTLVANSVRGGGTLSGYNCFTVDEGSAQAEFVCGTVSGTAVTAMTRGISPSTGTSTVASLQFAHRRGASVKITDFPVLQIIKAQLSGEDTFTIPLVYSTALSTSTIGQNASNLVNKAYVDSIAFNGAGVIDATTAAKGVSEIATAGEAAASTGSGSSGILVLPASLSTSTYNAATAASRIVMTGTDGTIDDDFLPRTIATTTTFSGTTTFTGQIVGIRNVRTYDANATWTKPTGIQYIRVRAWGAGGSGGASATAGNESGGGGGGGCVEATFASSTLGSTETVTIGTGGAAQTTNNGAVGGNTTFGSLLTAYGGGGGAGETTTGAGGGGGGGALAAGGNSTNGTGGTAGDILTTAGGSAVLATSAYNGAGGGGAANGGAGAVGGNSLCGGAGGGGAASGGAAAGGTATQGGAGGLGLSAASGNATTGATPGGGGGAKWSNAGTGSSGAGGGGRIIVYEFF